MKELIKDFFISVAYVLGCSGVIICIALMIRSIFSGGGFFSGVMRFIIWVLAAAAIVVVACLIFIGGLLQTIGLIK